MGNSHSKWEVLDWAVNRHCSQAHNISAWYEIKLKNSEYYDGTRFFTVSRSLYPNYTKGVLYGYEQDNDYWYNALSENE